MTIDLKGPNLLSELDIDHFTGNIKTHCVDIFYRNRNYDFNNTHIVAEQSEENLRTISLNSNYISTKIEGDFALTKLPKDLSSFFEEYLLSIQNDKKKINEYYNEKNSNTNTHVYPHKLKYSVNFKNPDPILKLIMPELSVSKGTSFSGEYINGLEPMITLDGKIEQITFGEKILQKNSLYFIATKAADQSQILSQFGISSDKQFIEDNLSTEKMSFNGAWEKDQISFTSFVKQKNSKNHLSLNGDIKLLEDTVKFQIDTTSELQVDNQLWEFKLDNNDAKPDNNVAFVNKDILVNNINIHNDSLSITQKITINGVLSENPKQKLIVRIDKFLFQNLSRIIGEEFTGQVSGNISLSDIYHQTKINSRLTAKNLNYNGTNIGYSSIMLNNTTDARVFKLNVNHFIQGVKAFHVTGSIKDLFEEENELDVKVTLDQLDTKIAEPFIYQNISNIKGLLNGEINVTGSTVQPNFVGNVYIKDMGCHVVYLNTDYTFHNAKINFKNDRAYFRNIIVKDHLENKGVLNGGISFDQGIYTDLNFYFKNLNLMNKQIAPEEDATFYGVFYGTGDIHVKGLTSDIEIYSNELKTEKRTKIFIPLQGYETAENKSYIRFVNKKDSINTSAQANEIDLSGIKLDLNLEVTDQAYAEIIFDKNAGDIIKSYGTGQMKIQLDTRGDFNLYGNYIINKGTYNFTLANVINKEFIIEPNSSISWTGDPYEGKMDIIAKYSQNASLAPILDTAVVDISAAEVRRKYPVAVEMNLTEQLLSPELVFDINITDYPSSLPGNNNNVVTTDEFINEFYSNIRANEQELNKQVFSLILLKRLSTLNSTANAGVRSGATGSMSELLGNYLSHLLSQVDENFEIDLDLTDFNNDSEDNLTYRLSYSFFDGRFRVTRSSTIVNDKNSTNPNSNNTNELVGDWTLEYSVTPDGKLRLKAFNKSESDIGIITQNNSVNMTYGASLLHTQSFNKLSDLFKRKNKKKKKSKR